MFLTFFRLQFKRMLRQIPYIIIGAMLLLSLTGSIAFLSSKALYGDSITEIIDIGVVKDEDQVAEKLLIDALREQETLKSLVEFKEVEQEDGENQLKSGQLQALLIVPKGFVSGIIHGKNEPAKFILSTSQPLESQLVQVLSTAGAKTLSTSQAALYAIHDLYESKGISEEKTKEMNQKVNDVFLGLSLSRSDAFRTQTVSSTGEVSSIIYFSASMIVLFLLLMGMVDAFLLKPLREDLQKKLDIEGIGDAPRILVDWINLSLVHFFLLFIIAFLWQQFIGGIPISLLMGLQLLFLSMSVSAFIIMIYSFHRDLLSSMLMLFGLSFVLLFFSGGLVPSSFLPGVIRKIQFLLPTTHWMKYLSDFLTARIDVTNLLLILFIALLCLILSYIGRKKVRREPIR